MKRPINKSNISRVISRATSGGVDEFLWDARLTGWGFKCSANGHTTWIVKQGNKRTKFADYPQVSIEVAKERGKELLKFKPSHELTLGDAVERYIENGALMGVTATNKPKRSTTPFFLPSIPIDH